MKAIDPRNGLNENSSLQVETVSGIEYASHACIVVSEHLYLRNKWVGACVPSNYSCTREVIGEHKRCADSHEQL